MTPSPETKTMTEETDARLRTVAEGIANIVGAPYEDWRHFTGEANAILSRLDKSPTPAADKVGADSVDLESTFGPILKDKFPDYDSLTRFHAAYALAEAAIAAMQARSAEPAPESGGFLSFWYKNYRGEVSERTVRPIRIYHGATEWHPEPQWLLEAFDMEKDAVRAFAMCDMQAPPAEPMGAGWIVSNGNGDRWRTWNRGWSEWTAMRDHATRYARRADAEAVQSEDEDVWRVEPYASEPAGEEPVCATCLGHRYLLMAPSTVSAGGERRACPVCTPANSWFATPSNPERLVAGMRAIQHSIAQARIPGNDWRRELVLIESVVYQALSAAPLKEGSQA